MNKTKLSLAAVLALVLVLGLSASSWARMGMGGGCGPEALNLTPEQAGKLFDLKEKFHNDTASLRKQMWIKRAELGALWRAEKPDQAKIEATQKELNALRDQMQSKATAMRLEARKIAPDVPFGRGMGMGHRGMGMGPGMGPGGGPGPGPGPGPGAKGM
jgi:zinc resistance-associated protein